MRQQALSDMEYGYRKKKTKREEFLEIMEEIIPWDEWVGLIRPYYPTGRRGRPPIELELILRMYLLQVWLKVFQGFLEGFRGGGFTMENKENILVTEQYHALYLRAFSRLEDIARRTEQAMREPEELHLSMGGPPYLTET